MLEYRDEVGEDFKLIASDYFAEAKKLYESLISHSALDMDEMGSIALSIGSCFLKPFINHTFSAKISQEEKLKALQEMLQFVVVFDGFPQI